MTDMKVSNQVRIQEYLLWDGEKTPTSFSQVLATVCACYTAVSYGANEAITSSIIFAFEKKQDEQIKMPLEEASWMRKICTTLT